MKTFTKIAAFKINISIKLSIRCNELITNTARFQANLEFYITTTQIKVTQQKSSA
ncbi:hypothetical protein P353_09850 [Comamonas testosteroni]|uniref:Uncharacterized protein n=1 Tax=Comamonas testosteroni TaxID=285 RepID=A0A096HNR1_COMTE|nr:hypothetical protein P353_09850 [Comamonas testosteroni]